MSSSSSSPRTAPTSSSRAACRSTPRSRRPCSSRPSSRCARGSRRWRPGGSRPPRRRAPRRSRSGRRARCSPSIPRPATSRPWSAATTSSRASSTAPPRRAASPGSAFKPFVYIAALEAGLTPASVVDDSPVEFPGGPNGKPWKPENYDRKFRGPITLPAGARGVGQRGRGQGARSASASAARSTWRGGSASRARSARTSRPGPGHLRALAARAHLRVRHARQPGQLDAAHRHPLRARRPGQAARGKRPRAQAGALARAGLRGHPHAARARSSAGPAWRRKALGRPGRGQDRHHQRLLERVVHRVHARSSSPGVWVGYDRPRSLGKDETGSRVAVPIWTTFMQAALAGMPAEDFPIPERVVLVPVDLDRAGGCSAARADGLRVGHRADAGLRARALRGPGVRPPRVEPPRLDPAPVTPGARGPPAGSGPVAAPRRRPGKTPSSASRLVRRARRPRRASEARDHRGPALALEQVPGTRAGAATRGHADLLHRIAVADRHLAVGPVSPLSVSPTVCTSTVTQ